MSITENGIETACDYLMRQGYEVQRDTDTIIVDSPAEQRFIVPNAQIGTFYRATDRTRWLAS